MKPENDALKTEKPDDKTQGAQQPESRDSFLHDASYTVEYAEEGVFLHVDYEDAGGRPLNLEIVLYDLNRRNISGLAVSDLNLRIKKHEENIRIADAQKERDADSDALDFVARGEMSAEMVLLPPCGEGHEISAEELLELIREKWGITFGVDEKAVREAVGRRKYYQKILIAQGKLPEKGEDGKIKFMFNREHNYAPKIDAEGNADYKNLNVFEGVLEGETVVEGIPPTDGVPGFTVKGKELPPKKGAGVKLPRGKNVKVSEDGLNLIAVKSGRVDYINGRVDINDVY